MGSLSLLTRRKQLELLAEACAAAAPAQIIPRTPAAGPPSPTRLVRLEPQGLLIAAPADPVRQPPPGLEVEVRFHHRQQAYAFRAHSRGLADRGQAGAPAALLRLTLPLRLVPCPAGGPAALELPAGAAIHVRLTSLLHQGRTLDLELRQLSMRGLRGTLCAPSGPADLPSGPLWAEFRLPGQAEPLACVVQRAGDHSDAADDATVHLAFCGADDPALLERSLGRLRRHSAAPPAERSATETTPTRR
jgi:hypothetical protein